MTGQSPNDPRPGWSWTIDPPPGWLVVPSRLTEPDLVDEWESAAVDVVVEAFEQSFAEAQAASSTPLPDPGPEVREAARQVAADSVASVLRLADDVAPDGHRVVAAARVRDRGLIPVLVVVGAGDPDDPDALMTAVGAVGGAPLAPPKVEYLDLPDGDGVRVTRLDLAGPDGSAWTSVALGRRTEDADGAVDTVLLWRTQDFFLVPVIAPELDDLLPAVTITRSAA